MTGDDIRRAIAVATPLVNPRLSEVEWDDVAAVLSDEGCDEVIPFAKWTDAEGNTYITVPHG